jgi:hypothetical protein
MFTGIPFGYPPHMKTILLVVIVLALAYGAYVLISRGRRT